MELKDVILSTLAEMEETPQKNPVEIVTQTNEEIEVQEVEKQDEPLAATQEATVSSVDGEMMYLNSIRERLLVLFEGFQAPNNTNIEAKVDMTLNFLEYVLATIDSRIETLEKGSSK